MQNKLILATLLAAAACGDDGNHAVQPDAPAAQPDSPEVAKSKCDGTPTDLRTDLAWDHTNRETLTAWLDEAGCKSPGFDKTHRPVALWDWDNTISKNDFGDAMTYWFISHGKVLQPPGQDWHNSSGYLTDAAVTALAAACGTTVAAGQPFPAPTATNHDCADEILSIYDNETTRAGTAAWRQGNMRRLEPAFAWTPQLMAGYTHAEVQAETSAMLAVELAAAPDTTQTIGTTTENGWLRIYDQQKDLIGAAQSRGYDVYIITASPQDVIQTAAAMVGVPADHVVGIRSKTDANGKLTTSFEGCGDVPDGGDVIPYVQGKRCYVNKVVYGDTGAVAWQRHLDRQWFAAGDSDSDVEFVRDARYHLAINRNKADLMCHALYNERGTWVYNQMFIEPKAHKATPYACNTAFSDEAGAAGQTRDEGGNPIPPQSEP
ncbi:MAG: haloacid dehalogenase-like hydrolase [Deltaproteobacteria bacterium]|nr:haloacid dehalogenase-like hydrolase [Deltaproteobacteria bacterium]